MGDDSVTRDEAGGPGNVGKSTGKRGEDRGKEAGARDLGTDGSRTERPKGGTSARESSGIDPQEPIDPGMPNIKRGGG
jgi:hypothetical protein